MVNPLRLLTLKGENGDEGALFYDGQCERTVGAHKVENKTRNHAFGKAPRFHHIVDPLDTLLVEDCQQTVEDDLILAIG